MQAAWTPGVITWGFTAWLLFTPLLGFAAEAPAPDPGEGEEAVTLEDVVVTSRRTVLSDKLTEKSVRGKEAERLPLIDNDILRAVQAQPGVVSSDFSARFSVRGGERNETLFLLDGIELYDPYHLQDYGGALSAVDLLAVSKAQLLLGGFPAEYGDRLSAVLDVTLKDPTPSPRLDVGLDLLNAHVFFSQKPLLIAARAGYIGFLMGLMDSEETLEPHYWDLLFKAVLNPGDRDRLQATVLYAGDRNRIDNAGVDDDVRSAYENGAAWLSWRRKDGGLLAESHLYTGWAMQRRDEGVSDLDNRDLFYTGFKARLSAPVGEALQVKSGMELRWMNGRYAFCDADRGLDLRADLDGYDLRGYVSSLWRITSTLSGSLGSRLVFLSWRPSAHLAPAASLTWRPVKGLSFRGAWGRYLQPVTPLNLPVEAGITSPVRPERAEHFVLGVQFRRADIAGVGINAKVEAYYKKMKDLSGFLRDLGRKSQVVRPAETGFATGAEFVLDLRVDLLLLQLGYTYSVAKERAEGRTVYRDEDQRHALSLGAGLDLGKDWRLHVSWRAHTGRPYTRVWYEGAVRHEGPVNGARLPPYHSLDLRVSKEFAWGDTKIQVYLQILNLYNRENVHEYSFTEVSPGEFSREPEGLFPLLPTLGINVSF